MLVRILRLVAFNRQEEVILEEYMMKIMMG